MSTVWKEHRYHREDHRPIAISDLRSLVTRPDEIIARTEENRNSREMYHIYKTSPTFCESVQKSSQSLNQLIHETQKHLDKCHKKNVNSKHNKRGEPIDKKGIMTKQGSDTHSTEYSQIKYEASVQPRKRLKF